jgi:hypothetical protein
VFSLINREPIGPDLAPPVRAGSPEAPAGGRSRIPNGASLATDTSTENVSSGNSFDGD